MKYIFWLVVLPLLVLLITGVVMEKKVPFVSEPEYIVTYSASHARYLGYDGLELMRQIINDYQPKQFRLQANWNEIEPEKGRFDFQELDALVALAKNSGATITLAIGRKLPRWPECHDPAWLADMRIDEIKDLHFKMLRTVIEHYRYEPAIIRWQLENEPLFSYGTCLAPNKHRLVESIKLLQKLDPDRPILLTDSGELSFWWETAVLTEELGTTLYRVTWNPAFGYFSYPWPAYYYRWKAGLVSPWVKKVVVSELQLEPWAPQGLKTLSLAEAQKSLSLQKFQKNIDLFRRTGFSEAFLWGVEWWYYARDNLGEPVYWQAGKNLFF